MQIRVKTDTITPELKRLIGQFRKPQKAMDAIAEELVLMTKRAFTDESLRPTPWPGSATLVRSGTLSRSPRKIESSDTHALIGTDRPYAAAHQFGSKPHIIEAKNKKALFWKGAKHPVKSVKHPGLPPRPFFPFDRLGKATDKAVKLCEDMLRSWITGK